MPAARTCNCMACPKCHVREWARRRYRLRAYGQWQPRGDLELVVAHLRALSAAGVGSKSVADASGVARTRIRTLTRGEGQWVKPETVERILAVTAADSACLPVFPVARRLQALNAIGYTTWSLAKHLSLAQTDVRRLMLGRGRWVTRRITDTVLAFYETASMRPEGNPRSIANARQKGYAAPLEWAEGDIDDPVALPCRPGDSDQLDPVVVERILGGDWRVPANKAERAEVCRRWAELGKPLAELARRTRWKTDRYYHKGEAA